MKHTNVTIYGIQFSWRSTLENSAGCFHANPPSFIWVNAENFGKLNRIKTTLNYYLTCGFIE